jgi:hypothetical protein
MDLWKTRFDAAGWKRFLLEGLNSPGDFERIRLATRTGRPLGNEEFVRLLEALTGRALRPQKRGPRHDQEN